MGSNLRDVIRVSAGGRGRGEGKGGFESTEFELLDNKWLEKWAQFQGKSDVVWDSKGFKFTEFELAWLYGIYFDFKKFVL